MSIIKVRFAPSPTGELHIGGARTALFNYLFAKAKGGIMVLRIDDTDLERSREEYTDKLIESMHWLGLEWDEGPYFQSKRLDIYSSEVNRLLTENKAYYCYCSVDELSSGREEARNENRPYLYPGNCRKLSAEEIETFKKDGRKPVVRLVIPDSGATVVNDLIRGEVSFSNSDLDDFIILKSNGLPTYNFASIVDDCKMEISHIIRAEEHLSNTPRQLLCAEALEYKLPVFAHVPMILAPDRSKLSKRHGATSVEEFRSEGYLPEALVNYMALLGWSPGEDREFLNLEEMIDLFSLDKVTKTAAIYDTNKLAWMNGNYMREYNTEKLLNAAYPFLEEDYSSETHIKVQDKAYVKAVINSVRERAKTLKELSEAADYFFKDDITYDEKGVKKNFKKEGTADLLKTLNDELVQLDSLTSTNTEALFNSLCENKNISLGRLMGPARLALTGKTGGPAIFDIIEILGKEKTSERLEKAVHYIEKELDSL